MNVRLGDGKTGFGTGVMIELDGDEVVLAIYAYLVSHGVHISGPATVRVNGDLIEFGDIYVDPSGAVVTAGKRYSGRGSVE